MSTKKLPGKFTVIEGLITPHDVFDLLERNTLTVLRYRRERNLPYVVLPRHGRYEISFKLDEVLDWMKSDEAKGLDLKVNQQALTKIRARLKAEVGK